MATAPLIGGAAFTAPGVWRTIAAGFLVEKAHRSGSAATVEVYGRTVARYLDEVADPASATPLEVMRFAYGVGLSRRWPSASTISVRLAVISGLYDFAQRMRLASTNPAAHVQRPRVIAPPPHGLSVNQIVALLRVIPDSPRGSLHRALIVTAVLTGLRRSELLGLRVVGSETGSSPVVFETEFKGGETRRLTLPAPAFELIAHASMRRGITLDPDSRPFPISGASFYAWTRRYGREAGLGDVWPHVLRHTAAKLRRETGATIEEVSQLLGHQSIATTAIYLQRLTREPDVGWLAVAERLGLGSSRAQLVEDDSRVGLAPASLQLSDSAVTPLRFRREAS